MFRPLSPRVALFVLLAASGCFRPPRSGHLHAIRDGGKATVVFHDASANRGHVDAQLASGEQCRGEFATVPDDLLSYGDPPADEHTQSGMLVLSCRDGGLIKCEFVRTVGEGGSGKCLDTKGAEYRLTF